MRLVEAFVFLPVAAALHVGVWAIKPQAFGTQSTGSQGQETVTLAAAASQHASLAQSWRSAPQTAPTPKQPRREIIAAARTQMTAPQSGPSLRPAPNLPQILPAAMPNHDPVPRRSPKFFEPAEPAQSAPGSPAPPAPDTPVVQSDTSPQKPLPPRPPSPRPDASAQADTESPLAPAKPKPVAKAEPTPKPPRKTQSAASAPSRKSSGGAAAKAGQTGQTGRDETQSANKAQRQVLQARWGAKIQRRVHQRMIYPRGATGTGVAQVALTVSPAGQLTALRLTRPSGVAAFDKAALGAVRRAGRFPKAPKGLERKNYSFTMSLSFRP